MNGEPQETIAKSNAYVTTATSNQPSVASEPALSTEEIIGIIGLLVAVFVPLIGFLLRRLLSKKLAQQPMPLYFTQEPQLG